MVRVTVDLAPAHVWQLQRTAIALGITLQDAVRRELAANYRHHTITVDQVTRARSDDDARALARYVVDGLCDADIATRLDRTPSWVARVRRNLGLPANRRYAKDRT